MGSHAALVFLVANSCKSWQEGTVVEGVPFLISELLFPSKLLLFCQRHSASWLRLPVVVPAGYHVNENFLFIGNIYTYICEAFTHLVVLQCKRASSFSCYILYIDLTL